MATRDTTTHAHHTAVRPSLRRLEQHPRTSTMRSFSPRCCHTVLTPAHPLSLLSYLPEENDDLSILTFSPDETPKHVKNDLNETATSEMDTCVMRYLLSWHTCKCSPHDPSSPNSPTDSTDDHVLSSLEFTGAFLITLNCPKEGLWFSDCAASYLLAFSPTLWGLTRDEGIARGICKSGIQSTHTNPSG
eukprot:1575237-Amphidinium_carterae.1